jgi:anti-anti-sigma factor
MADKSRSQQPAASLVRDEIRPYTGAGRRSTGPASRTPTAVLALTPVPGARPAATRWSETQAVVSVRGELDLEALWGIDYTIGRAALQAGRIVLDLLEVTHLDYAGVGELVARRQELVERGGELTVAVRNPYVANILKAAGGAGLPLHGSVAEASGEAQVAVAGRRAAVSRKKKDL